jgi:(R,R)-butanediol dehydrogenase/meso-butanediol dehydrogenase/diacetyl reductase
MCSASTLLKSARERHDMKAAIYPGGGKPLTIETLPDPEPGAGEVIIKVHRCGICGTDLHMTSGHAWDFPAGCVPGHEYAGEIVAIGAGVDGYATGDRITALPSTGCGTCEACRRGNLVLCRSAPGVMGGFAEYMRVPSQVTVKLPATLSLADGALIEPLAVALHGVRMAGIKPGDRVLVLGAGSVALCAIYWARRLGAGRIAATSRSARRADMARDMGADAFILHGDTEVAEVVEALGGAPDIVFECVGVPGFLMKGVQHAAPFGQVISLGFCIEPEQLLPAMAAFKAVTLHFPVGYTLAEFAYVAREMDRGHVDPKLLISAVAPLGELPEILERLRGSNAETKVHIAPA